MLQDAVASSVGYLPPPAVEQFIETGNIRIALENHEPCGFVTVRPKRMCAPHVAVILQTAIQFDARRDSHASRIVRRSIADMLDRGQSHVECWCRADLDANLFWMALGFRAIAHRDVPSIRGKRGGGHFLWRWSRPGAWDRDVIYLDARERTAGGNFASPGRLAEIVTPFADIALVRMPRASRIHLD